MGNPASVTLFPEEPRNHSVLQKMAEEYNLPINVFIWALENKNFFAKYFTPSSAVPISGHGTLSASHVIWEAGLVPKDSEINLETLAGPTTATRTNWGIRISLPIFESIPVNIPDTKIKAMGLKTWRSVFSADLGKVGFDTIVELENPHAVKEYIPNFQAIVETAGHALVLTAKSKTDECDYVVRYFAPKFSLPEDWVTGLANCSLIPFWAKRLKKKTLIGHQVSRRPGFVLGELEENNLYQSGKVITVLKGTWKNF